MAVNNQLMEEIRLTQPFIWGWVASGKVSNMNGQWPHYSYRRWSQLLGYSDLSELVHNSRDEHIQIIRDIRGPHGFAIYKMLEAQCNGKTA